MANANPTCQALELLKARLTCCLQGLLVRCHCSLQVQQSCPTLTLESIVDKDRTPEPLKGKPGSFISAFKSEVQLENAKATSNFN